MSTKCVPTDYFDIVAWDTDGTYLYGSQSSVASKYLARQDLQGNRTTLKDVETLTGQAAGSYPSTCIVSDSVLFVVVKNSSNQSFLYKSIDGGVNFGDNAPTYDNGNYVDRIGWDGSTHVDAVTILGNRGFLTAADGALYYGEYNTNSSRVSGGSNDRVAIRYSIDGGDTWSLLWQRNTSGHQCTHCHLVAQDPYTGDIYFGFGDGAADSGTVKWDGSTPFTDNIDYPELVTTPGFNALYGAVRNQTTDLIFTTDYGYVPVDDGSTDSERGIWRFPRDMSSYTQVDSQVLTHNNHAMYWALKLADGTLIATELLEAAATDNTLFIYVSDDGGETWKKSGSINLRASATNGRSPAGLFAIGNTIYFSSSRLAGQDYNTTSAFNINGDFSDSSPEIVAPVYYVDNGGGSDSNNGYKRNAAFATLGYALTGNRVTHGARVLLSDGQHDVSANTVAWQANARAGEITNITVVEGEEGTTSLNVSGQLTIQAGDGDIALKNIRELNNPLFVESGYDGTLTNNSLRGKIKWA